MSVFVRVYLCVRTFTDNSSSLKFRQKFTIIDTMSLVSASRQAQGILLYHREKQVPNRLIWLRIYSARSCRWLCIFFEGDRLGVLDLGFCAGSWRSLMVYDKFWCRMRGILWKLVLILKIYALNLVADYLCPFMHAMLSRGKCEFQKVNTHTVVLEWQKKSLQEHKAYAHLN